MNQFASLLEDTYGGATFFEAECKMKVLSGVYVTGLEYSPGYEVPADAVVSLQLLPP